MTPYEIDVFLHHATSAAPYERASAPAYPETMLAMVRAGLFIQSDDHAGNREYRMTEKAEAFLRMLEATPLPEVRFIDPRDGRRA